MKKEEISQQTKRQLAASLKKFMTKKPFDKITVRELLDDCNMTRPTFYYHFKDIFDLLEWMLDIEAIELLKRSDGLETWDEGLLLLFRYIQDNDRMCLCAYNSIGMNALNRMLFRNVQSVMRAFVNHLRSNLPVKEEHVTFIADFYTMALVNCVAKWMTDGMKKTPEEMIALLDMTLHGSILAALKRSVDMK